MNWTPPANRRNQHTARWHYELYAMPQSDKTGILSRSTVRANAVIARHTYKYQIGLRVTAIDRRNAQHVTGTIETADWGMGITTYSILDDDGKRYYAVETDIRMVLSLAIIPVQAITVVTSAQHTQTGKQAA